MKNIPHDYYLRFMDTVVHEQIMDFHIKGNYVLHDAVKKTTALHFIEAKHLAALTGNELKLYPDFDACLPLKTIEKSSILHRSDSCETFSNQTIDFTIIEKLVSPLTGKNKSSYKRGYPSGGALYPIETFVVSLMDNEPTWPCPEKVLHLLPHSQQFEIMQNTQCTKNLRSAILSAPGDIGTPAFAIIYAAYLPKTVFKYRYRGYRLALMETGSIYMLIELQAKKLQLRSRLWSAYTDTMVCKAIGLNPAVFLPLCVHLLGKEK